MTYAQTNLQLYGQLQALQYSDGDRAAVEKSYNFAMEIFTGQFRPTKKPFLCHLVGTASILASMEEPIETVIAGLLHASYSHGDFGDGSRGVTKEKQRQLGQVIGEKSEALIAAYTGVHWSEETVRTLETESREKRGMAYDILTIRLADILEDSLDFGMAYSAKQKKFGKNGTSSLDSIRLAKEVARHLGHHHVEADLEKWGTGEREQSPVSPLGSSLRGSFVLAPKSYRVSFLTKMQKGIQSLRRSRGKP